MTESEKKQSHTGNLKVENLVVEYRSGGQTIHAVNHISFELPGGRALGLVGETGAGKTTTAKSIMRILPDYATQKVEGKILYNGEDLLKLEEVQIR